MVTGKKVKVNILGTTYEAFSTLIKFIYCVPDYLPLTADVQKLNDVLKIAERYHVIKLANEVRMTIERFHIKSENDILGPIKEERTMDDPLSIENMYDPSVKIENDSVGS